MLKTLALITAAALAALPATAEGGTTMEAKAAVTPAKTGHLEVRGVNYYYEIHGRGRAAPPPSWRARLDRHVRADPADARRAPSGDRRRPPRSRPHDPRRSADQPARHGRRHGGILQELGYRQVDVLGYSFGGGVAFRLAVQHPDLVRRLAMVSAGFAQDGFYPEMLPMQAAVGAGMADDDEGHADVQVLRRGRAEPGGVPKTARPYGRATCASPTTGPRT